VLSPRHAIERLVDFNAFLFELPFALMKACCWLAETFVSFLLLQQLSEDFYYWPYEVSISILLQTTLQKLPTLWACWCKV